MINISHLLGHIESGYTYDQYREEFLKDETPDDIKSPLDQTKLWGEDTMDYPDREGTREPVVHSEAIPEEEYLLQKHGESGLLDEIGNYDESLSYKDLDSQ